MSLREELLDYQRDFYKKALREADNDTYRAYIFKAEKDPARSYHLADILLRQEIDFFTGPLEPLKWMMKNTHLIIVTSSP